MTPPDEAAAPRTRAAFPEEIKPYVAAVGAVSLVGLPAEVLVPLVRRLTGRTGVAAGPGLTNLANGVVALVVTRYVRRRPGRWTALVESRAARPLGVASLLHVALAPAVAGRWERAVVLRGRSPLWGWQFSPIGLLQLLLVLVAVRRAGRATAAQ